MPSLFFRLCLSFFACLPVIAQIDRGSITGTVTDPSGAAMAGVTITATETSTNVSTRTTTTQDGIFTIPYLLLGNYTVMAETKGFKRAMNPGVIVDAASRVRVDLAMQLGAVTEQVEVHATAPLLRQESADVSQQVASETILRLPLTTQGAGRSPLTFAFLTPGVQGDEFGSFKAGGSSMDGVEMLLDGLSVSLNTRNNKWEGLSPESIAEFRVITNSFDAEYGHTFGAFLSFVSKSGTNDLHGNFYEFLRNDVFDARGAVQPSTPINRQNNFGATIGGPISIPRLYSGKNRTFFFAGYEGFRYHAGASNTFVTLPTHLDPA